MRIGLLADIHGNLLALDTVLSDLAHDAEDQVMGLGDVAALGPQPREVIARLRTLGCPVVMGNTDAWLLDPPEALDASTRASRAIARWCAEQLSAADLASARTFRPTIELSLGAGMTMLCYHGSPRSFDDVIAVTTPDETVARMLGEQSAAIMVGGHTHTHADDAPLWGRCAHQRGQYWSARSESRHARSAGEPAGALGGVWRAQRDRRRARQR